MLIKQIYVGNFSWKTRDVQRKVTIDILLQSTSDMCAIRKMPKTRTHSYSNHINLLYAVIIFRLNQQLSEHKFMIGFHCLFRFYELSMLELMKNFQLISKNRIHFFLFSIFFTENWIIDVLEMREKKAHLWFQKFKFTYPTHTAFFPLL